MRWLLRQSILWHRWLGICFCVFFCFWFISGIVLMYADFPHLSEADRLRHAPLLDLSAAKFTPEDAFDRANAFDTPARVTIGMLGARPVYRMQPDAGPWVTVFADDGAPLRRVDADTALRIAASYDGVKASQLRAVGELKARDQWTVFPGSRGYAPFQIVAAADGKGTEYYVSERTGSVYLRTDRRSRFLAWIGAIPHWWYIRALRVHDLAWARTIMAASGIGILMCVAGIVAGILRFSPSRRYRFPDATHSLIPYRSWKRWHYLFAMFAGVATFTWILSGLFSMDPGDWSPGADPEADEMAAFAGGYLDTALFTLPPAQAVAALRGCIGPSSIEMLMFGGKPYYLARDRDAKARLLPADTAAPAATCFNAVPLFELVGASQRVVPGAPVLDSALLTSYDAYYYDRTRQKPLPVLRLRFGDARKTWLYLDPGTARIAARYTSRSRLERWLYQGLHDLDFPFLYWHRPAWDFTVIALSLGGIALSITGIVMAFDYSRRSVKRKMLRARR